MYSKTIIALVICVSTATAEGLLLLGDSRAEESRATVPITIEGNVGNGVASLNFELRYNPAAVRVVGVEAGEASVQSGKQVQWHETEPGRMNVVVMGFNQETLRRGEIAQLTVEPVGSHAENARIRITNPSLASTTGDLIPSRGSSTSVDWTSEDSDTDESNNSGHGPRVPEPAPTPPPTEQGPDAAPVAGTAVDSRELAVADGILGSVEERLRAARAEARLARSLLGTSRDAVALEQPDESERATLGEVTSADAGGVRPVPGVESDRRYPPQSANIKGTPKKILESIELAGHNTEATQASNRSIRGYVAVSVVASLVFLLLVLTKFWVR